MREYVALLNELAYSDYVYLHENRTSIPTVKVFGRTLRHNMGRGFPLVTTKFVSWKTVLHELLWFLKGTENTSYLKDNNVTIWNEWEVNGKLPHTYGVKWRDFYGKDQITWLIDEIRTNPLSRRLFVSAWDAANLENCALPWCHTNFQINILTRDMLSHEALENISTESNGLMDLQFQMRSVDTFLGMPYNIASYGFLLSMIAATTRYTPNNLIGVFGDTHLYINHLEQARTQVQRIPRPLPWLEINPQSNIYKYTINDFIIHDYNPHPKLKGDVAV